MKNEGISQSREKEEDKTKNGRGNETGKTEKEGRI